MYRTLDINNNHKDTDEEDEKDIRDFPNKDQMSKKRDVTLIFPASIARLR